jgi:hypothetical protein
LGGGMGFRALFDQIGPSRFGEACRRRNSIPPSPPDSQGPFWSHGLQIIPITWVTHLTGTGLELALVVRSRHRSSRGRRA